MPHDNLCALIHVIIPARTLHNLIYNKLEQPSFMGKIGKWFSSSFPHVVASWRRFVPCY